MGVAGLWDILQPTVTPVPLSLLSLSYILNDTSLLPYDHSLAPPHRSGHLAKHDDSSSSSPSANHHPHRSSRPRALRLGIDASLWIFHARSAPGGSNPFLRTMFFKVLRLVREGVLCLFVFDGPNKPRLKRNQLNTGSFGSRDVESRSFKALLDEMGMEWWDAPGEAEAELANLTRIGQLDAVLTDDVDALVFGATCVLRNPSKTLSANLAAAANSGTTFETRDDYQVYRLGAIELHEDVGLDVDGLILIGLMSGGDYHTAGIPKCGPKIAHGIARSGLGGDLLQNYQTLSATDFRSYLPSFLAKLKVELSTNRSGFLPNKRKALADTIPSDFPNVDVLDYYVNPMVSKVGEGWEGFGSRAERAELSGMIPAPGAGKRGGRGDPRGFARACERWFEWGYKEEVGRRLRTLAWRGEIVGQASVAMSDSTTGQRPDSSASSDKVAPNTNKATNSSTNANGLLASYFTPASSSAGLSNPKSKSPSPFTGKQIGAFPAAKLISISAVREHPSTGFMSEYRVAYDPSEWNAVALDAMDGTRLEPRFLTDEQRADLGMVTNSQSDATSGSEASTGIESGSDAPRRRREKKTVDLGALDKAWLPAELVRQVWPQVAEEYDERIRAKAEKVATPKKTRAPNVQPVPVLASSGLLSGWLTGKKKQAVKTDGKDNARAESSGRQRPRSASPAVEITEAFETSEVPERGDSRRTITGARDSTRSTATVRRYPTPPPEFAHIPYRTPSPVLAQPKKKGARPPLSISSSSTAASDISPAASRTARSGRLLNKPSPRKNPRIGSDSQVAARPPSLRAPSPAPQGRTKLSHRRPSTHAGDPARRLPLGRRNSDVIDLTDSDEDVMESPDLEGTVNKQLKPKHWAGKPKPSAQYTAQRAASADKPARKPSAPGHSSSTSYFGRLGPKRQGHLASASSVIDLEDSDSSGSDLDDPTRLSESLDEIARSLAPHSSRKEDIQQEMLAPLDRRRGSGQSLRGGPDANDASFSSKLRRPPRKRHSSFDLLPIALSYNDSVVSVLSRLSIERALFHGSVMLAIWKLCSAGEIQVAAELAAILLLSLAYLGYRSLGRVQVRMPIFRLLIRRVSRRMFQRGIPSDPGRSTDRTRNAVIPVGFKVRTGWRPPERSVHRYSMDEQLAGCSGRIWATDEKDYRECIDDGASYAFLFGPMLAATMFYDSWTRLRNADGSLASSHWKIERPVVLDSTPDFVSSGVQTSGRDQGMLARVALALSRRHLIHLTCMLSLALGVHVLYSRGLEAELMAGPKAAVDTPSASSQNGPDTPLVYWSKRGEWRRTAAIILFAMWVMIGFVSIKAGAHFMDWTAAWDLTYTDIILATLFYQFCLYVCVRLARRGFTLGELGVVCHAATGLFMETVNMTRMKISVFRTPYVRTYRMATPLLVFQLALIPGSFLTGVLLSPVLVLSRKIARKPEYRLRLPLEKQTYRQALAAAFYGGSAIICGGVIGSWTWWCLGDRNPWVWVVMFLTEGAQWWSRPALMAYWGALAVISVAGWTRQLVRSRRKRAWTESAVTADGRRHLTVRSKAASSGTVLSDGSVSTPRTGSPAMGKPRAASMASQMMDSLDHRLPTFSVNARRKYFHALAVVLFVPGMIIDPAFTHLACSVAFAGFTFAEYIRYFAVYPLGAAVHLFLNEFLDSKDSGTAIMSHFYLLTGCAGGVWLEGPTTILNLFGVLALGVGDALASIVGKRYGRIRWSTSSGKTVEGSVAFFSSVFACGCFLTLVPGVQPFSLIRFGAVTALVAIMEAVSEQNDNLILPIWGWCLGVLLQV